MYLQGKNKLFSKGTNYKICIVFGWYPTRKGADMDKFNVSLLLIFMILFILKNGSRHN